jgi:NDP-sugar pyrophosphorylase family protein
MKERMIAIILAGGVGKRLGGVSLRISKAMLPILGVPITAETIEQIREETPIRRFVVVVRTADQDIASFLRNMPPKLNSSFNRSRSAWRTLSRRSWNKLASRRIFF